MAERSLRASQAGIARAENALTDKGWSRQDLADRVVIEGKKTTTGISIQTVHKFLTGEKVDRKYFVGICKALDLPWNEIEELAKQPKPECPQPKQGRHSEIDALVQEVRQRVQPYIQERCGTMRVLDMTQPVALGDIYTSVNILNKITGRRGVELTELMRDVSPEKFDRFCLGDVRERRVPGLEAIETFSKLMILGKPGAGKTTFLKHLAIQCIGGKFQGDRVPVFVTLKDFAEADGQPDLLEYIERLVGINPVGARHAVPLPTVLAAGRALILLDGLDEVRDADSSRVLRQIRDFSQQFPQNQFVITCRLAAREYTFERFTEVEIADFDDKQIADFSDKWFRSKNDPIKAERFVQKLEEDEPIRELATNPLLLTLLCLVFEDSGSFPTNRAELYQTGVDVLLKKWDVKRNIEREQVYKRLSLKRKEDLLSQIARTTFEAGNYFFKQREVERYITQYIQNLPDASTDPEALELDSAAVLKSIEAHHGLFVERARGIYSFSHLTFHEYFTARKIVTSCNPYAADDPTLQSLVTHLTETRWREVFLLTVGMLDSADTLVQLMKQQVDSLIANDEKLEMFLFWIYWKSALVDDDYYKPVAIRVFYLCIEYIYRLGIFTCDQFIDLANRFGVHVQGIPLEIATLDFERELYQLLDFFCDSSWFTPKDAIAKNIDDILKYFKLIPALKDELQQLKYNLPELPDPDRDPEKFQEVWADVRPSWTEQLRSIMIKYCNIGYDWQFSEEQIEFLMQYYDANEFLLECLDSDCYVSREVRQEIEETLLLPLTEIEKRKRLNR
jgi:predicted NACHT family NTPase